MKGSSDPEEILVRLFGSVSRGRILDLLISNADRSFYQREIMFETGLSLQPTQRELNNLVGLGIVTRHEIGPKIYYEINTDSPNFKSLSETYEAVNKDHYFLKERQKRSRIGKDRWRECKA